ncbi:MAG: DUF2271 domain-containing protein [Spirochaetales bacterium]|nr:DUF2271 domain-containing protein [Spirochaetales bacterium]
MGRNARILSLGLALLACASTIGAQPAEAAGRVTITYTLNRLSRIASNQLAIWIEDANGRFLRTLMVTDFAGRDAGWKRRPQTLVRWRQAAEMVALAQREIDAVSAATPPSGTHSVDWDLRDRDGRAVPQGTYRYRIDGNISWDTTVMWTGTIEVGGGPQTSRAAALYSPAGAEAAGALISEVSALYEPGP